MPPSDERPTCPPTEADEAALAFARRVAELDARERSRNAGASGLLRALAEGWHECTDGGKIAV